MDITQNSFVYILQEAAVHGNARECINARAEHKLAALLWKSGKTPT